MEKQTISVNLKPLLGKHQRLNAKLSISGSFFPSEEARLVYQSFLSYKSFFKVRVSLLLISLDAFNTAAVTALSKLIAASQLAFHFMKKFLEVMLQPISLRTGNEIFTAPIVT